MNAGKIGHIGVIDGSKCLKQKKSFALSFDPDFPKLFSHAKITSSGKIYETDRAIWDTGASITCISHSGASSLTATPVDHGTAVGATAKGSSNIYLATIELPGGIIFRNIELWDVDLNDAQYDVVIGMDIISRGDLHVISSEARPTFYFETTNG